MAAFLDKLCLEVEKARGSHFHIFVFNGVVCVLIFSPKAIKKLKKLKSFPKSPVWFLNDAVFNHTYLTPFERKIRLKELSYYLNIPREGKVAVYDQAEIFWGFWRVFKGFSLFLEEMILVKNLFKSIISIPYIPFQNRLKLDFYVKNDFLDHLSRIDSEQMVKHLSFFQEKRRVFLPIQTVFKKLLSKIGDFVAS